MKPNQKLTDAIKGARIARVDQSAHQCWCYILKTALAEPIQALWSVPVKINWNAQTEKGFMVQDRRGLRRRDSHARTGGG
jgi:hypothetical protein